MHMELEPYSVMIDGDQGDGVYLLDDGARAFDDGLGAMMEMTYMM